MLSLRLIFASCLCLFHLTLGARDRLRLAIAALPGHLVLPQRHVSLISDTAKVYNVDSLKDTL